MSPNNLSSESIKTNERALQLASIKWEKFINKVMKVHTTQTLQKQISFYGRWAVIFRVFIIIVAASITVMSSTEIDPSVVTVVAGILTATTGIEAYLQFAERRREAQRQQREVDALRQDLRFDWFRNVEMETDETQQLEAARRLLEDGPKSYDDILNKYVLKSEEEE